MPSREARTVRVDLAHNFRSPGPLDCGFAGLTGGSHANICGELVSDFVPFLFIQYYLCPGAAWFLGYGIAQFAQQAWRSCSLVW